MKSSSNNLSSMIITHPKRAISFCDLGEEKNFPKTVINTPSLNKQLDILYLTHKTEKY